MFAKLPSSSSSLVMYPTATSFYLPDLLSLSKPFKGSTNSHYRKAAAESRAWVNSYNIFTDRKRAFFIQGYNELLVSHTYPHAGYEEFRTICDFVNLLFVVDEVSDDQNGADARRTGEVYLNAMKYPGWTDGSPLAKMTGEYVLTFQLLPFVLTDTSQISCTAHAYLRASLIPALSKTLRGLHRVCSTRG